MRSACLPIDEIDAATKASMANLLGQHFEKVTYDIFETDLADKTHAVLLFDDNDEISGFSTFAISTTAGRSGEPTTVVCSGDTIVASNARRSSMLPSSWVQAVHAIHEQTGNADLYWLLITSGYRTYRFLPVFVKAYWPRVRQECDAGLSAWMHRLATNRWAERYDPDTGIVRLENAQPLLPHLSEVPDGRRADPHIDFFLERNPGHARGDELVSLARLNASNLTPAGLRMLHAKTATQTSESSHR